MKGDIYSKVVEVRKVSMETEIVVLYVTKEVNGFGVFLRLRTSGMGTYFTPRSTINVPRDPIAWFDSRDSAIEFGVRYSPEKPFFAEESS
ncbi:MAG: hypothetical protein HC882_07635 [Acidobacteria bacterium]|nr:hypothetical protein [Acidobacteriota bacterium]